MICKKIVICGILLTILLSSVDIPASSQGEPSWWDKNWSFRQEIQLPISTEDSFVKYQPIDIRIKFNDVCWAKNEHEHSVRVAFQDGSNIEEIESQIYDLNYSDNNHITSCSLVFLVPEIANGKDNYYVYYDDKEKSSPDYPNHVSVSKEHYYYEPIPGQKADIDYYKIIDESFCVYGVGIQGMMMIDPACQMIFRQEQNQKDLSFKYWDKLTSFCFQYRDNNRPVGEDVISTRQSLISSEILADGNLMVVFKIVSTSSRNDVKTTIEYKYYYCPLEIKRICLNVKHEFLKNIEINKGEMMDGSYVFMSGFKTRSEANQFLNTGEILPYIHFYDTDGSIKEIEVDTNPTSREEDWMISLEDNGDLGNNAWFSSDNGESGKGHAIIFSSNTDIVKSGTNERDGFQIKASEKQETDIPGLKAYSLGIDCGRNSYEPGSSQDTSIPSNLVVEFDANFFTTENNGYKDIQKEAIIYQALIKDRPLFGGNVSDIEEEGAVYNLSIYTHLVPSFPLGSLLSAVSGKNFSYVYAELYREGSLVSSGICSRISLAGGLDIDTENFDLSSIINLFDWKDISLFKKIRIPKLVPGTYAVRIYLNIHGQSKYVGVKSIVLKEDMRADIYCSGQGKIELSVVDHQGEGVPKAQCYLFLGNVPIAEDITNDQGESIISAPRGKYQLRVLYNGFKLLEKEIRIGIFSKEEHLQITLSNLELIVKDKLGLPPGIKITPFLTSEEMEVPGKILSQEKTSGVYLFIYLPEANYKIRISYKTFLDEKDIRIPGDGDTAHMVFSPLFDLTTKVFDKRGSPLKETEICIARGGKESQSITDENGVTSFFVPPGSYKINAYSDNQLIGEKQEELTRDKTVYLVTTEEPTYPLIIMVVSLLVVIIGALLVFLKKISLFSFLKILGIALIFSALVMPWWGLSGSSVGSLVERSTETFLIPQSMITTTVFGDIIELGLSNIPQEFTDFLFMVLALSVASCLFVTVGMFLKKYKRISLGLTFVGVLILIVSICIFVYGFSELTKVGLGSLQGADTLNILTPGTNEYVDISASWGLSSGAVMAIIAVILLIIAFVMDFRRGKKRKDKV